MRIQGTNVSIAKLAMGCGFDSNGKPFMWHLLRQPETEGELQNFVHDEFPATTLDEIAVQRPTACDQAVMAIGWRERRLESECLAATVTDAAANPDPIMMFIMGLFATTVRDRRWNPARKSGSDAA
jgi:hypothetical protein